MAQASYQSVLGRSAKEVHIAQEFAVNLTVQLALNQLFRHYPNELAALEFLVPGHDPVVIEGKTPEEKFSHAIEAIADYDQYDKIMAFNQLARICDMDLRLKSTGAKSPGRILEKVKSDESHRKGSNTDKKLTPQEIADTVRLSIIAENPQTLTSFSDLLQASFQFVRDTADEPRKPHYNQLLQKEGVLGQPYLLQTLLQAGMSAPKEVKGRKGARNFDAKVTDWEVTKTSFFSKKLNSIIDGLGAEFMFLPIEQAHMGSRISHKYYTVVRSWDLYDEEVSAGSRARKRKDTIAKYNSAAGLVNLLISDHRFAQRDLDHVNSMLASPEMREETFDDVSEGGELEHVADIKKLDYSPIFKNISELNSYRRYMLNQGQSYTITEAGKQVPLFPLPVLEKSSTDESMRRAMARLNAVIQLTHACYIGKSTKEMRQIYLETAHDRNNKVPETQPVIPSNIMTSIAQGENPAKDAIDIAPYLTRKAAHAR